MPVSNRNTLIMANFVRSRLGQSAINDIFKDLSFPKREGNKTFKTPEQYFTWEFGWHSLKTYNDAYLNLRHIFGPDVYEECGATVGKFVNLGSIKNLKYALGGVEGALCKVPEINRIFNDTKEFIILDEPRRIGNVVEATYIIRFHDDIDPHKDWKSDPHIRRILSQIACVWGLAPGIITQMLVPYSLEKLCRYEFEFERLDLDPQIKGDTLLIRDPLNGQQRILAERIVLDQKIVDSEKDERIVAEHLYGTPLFEGKHHSPARKEKGDYTGFKVIAPLVIENEHKKDGSGASAKTVLFPEGTILAEGLYFVTQYRSLSASRSPVTKFLKAFYYKYFGKDRHGSKKDWLETHLILTGENKAKEEALRENRHLIATLESRVQERTTELSKANIQLQQSMSDLKQAQAAIIAKGRTETLGEITAGVAHEINNPAAGILATSELLIEQKPLEIRYIARLAKLLDGKAFDKVLEIGQKVYEKNIENRMSTRERRERTKSISAIVRKYAHNLNDERIKELTKMQMDEADLNYLMGFCIGDILEEVLSYLSFCLLSGSEVYTIRTGSRRIVELTSALKGHVHLDEAAEGPVNIEKGIEDAILVLSNKLKNIELRREYQDVPVILGYPRELSQVWLNLLTNAYEAVKGNGTITVGIHDRGEVVVVSVSDTGEGIRDEIKNKIFDPFFTTKGRAYGTGLGLSICKDKVALHKGSIHVHSCPGQTTFEVKLPKKLST